MRLFPRSYIKVIISGLCFLASATDTSAQDRAAPPVVSPAPTLHNTVQEDSGAWRRKNPFIESSQKSVVLASPGSTPIKTGAKFSGSLRDGDLNIQGIMQTDRKFHALINGRTVKAGDVIDGFTIKEIHRYSVVVLNERKEKITYDIYQGRINRGKK